jgi:hypothetical protein
MVMGMADVLLRFEQHQAAPRLYSEADWANYPEQRGLQGLADVGYLPTLALVG